MLQQACLQSKMILSGGRLFEEYLKSQNLSASRELRSGPSQYDQCVPIRAIRDPT